MFSALIAQSGYTGVGRCGYFCNKLCVSLFHLAGWLGLCWTRMTIRLVENKNWSSTQQTNCVTLLVLPWPIRNKHIRYQAGKAQGSEFPQLLMGWGGICAGCKVWTSRSVTIWILCLYTKISAWNDLGALNTIWHISTLVAFNSVLYGTSP